VKNRAVPILVGRREIVPVRLNNVGTQINGKEAVEVRQAFLGEEIQSKRDARWITYSPRALSQFFEMAVRILSGWWLQQLRGKPQHTLGFVRRHQLGDNWLEIAEHLDLR